MYKLFLTVGLLGFTASTLGCSSDDENDPTATRAGFCAEWGKAACSAEVVSVCQATSAEACIRSQEDFCLSLVPSAYVSETAAACLKAVSSAYTDGDLRDQELVTVLRLGAPCDRLVRGPASSGQECTSLRDCDAPGGYECVVKGDEDTGTCQIPVSVTAGMDCSAAQQVCAGDFYCNAENCVAFRKANASCEGDAECGPEARCNLDADGLGTCSALTAVGESCASDAECQSQICLEFATGSRCTTRVVLSPSEPLCDDLR